MDLFRQHADTLWPMVEEMRRDEARGFRWDRDAQGVKWLDGTIERERMVEIVSACEHGALRGKDLACWCPLGRPCHADVLLELANR